MHVRFNSILAGAPLAQFNATLTGGLFACPLIGSETNCYSIGNEFMSTATVLIGACESQKNLPIHVIDQNFNVTMDRQLFGQSLTVKQQSADSDSQIHVQYNTKKNIDRVLYVVA